MCFYLTIFACRISNCYYLQKCIINNQPVVKKIIPVKLFINVLNLWFYFWADSDILIKNKIPISSDTKFIEVSLGDEERSFELFSDMLPVCQECYKEFSMNNNIRDLEEIIK
jgi:hypothetical protein